MSGFAMPLPGDPAPPEICNGLKWSEMTRVLVELGRRFLSVPEYIDAKWLKAKYWRDPPTADSIDVTSAATWKPDTARKRPAVTISRQDVGCVKTSIGDKLHGGVDLKGARLFSHNLVGQHTITAVGRTEPEAEELAAEMHTKFSAHGLDILNAYGLLSFQVLKIGGPGRIAETTDLIGVPVPIAWALEERWMIMPQALTLAKLTVEIPDPPS